jgi:hypothetical protein
VAARDRAAGLGGVLGGSTAQASSLGDGVGDRSAVLQSVAQVHHLVAVVLVAPVRGPRRRWEAVSLLPQPQRVRADVEYRGCLVDRERGSTLLLRMYRQPGSTPLAISRIADGSRRGHPRVDFTVGASLPISGGYVRCAGLSGKFPSDVTSRTAANLPLEVGTSGTPVMTEPPSGVIVGVVGCMPAVSNALNRSA